MIDTIDRLLDIADPDGIAAANLRRWRAQLERNVMLGPGPLAYINRLLRVIENPECKWLTNDGHCLGLNLGAYCPHNDPGAKFSACAGFDPHARVKRGGKEVL